MLVPLLFFVVVATSQPMGSILGLIVFSIASLTDYYDGKYARKYKTVSNFGKIMDPIADKLLVGTALFILVIKPLELIPLWIFLIIVFREVFVTLYRLYYAKRHIILAANLWGKLKTTIQIFAIILSFLVYIFTHVAGLEKRGALFGFTTFVWYIAVAITLISGVKNLYVGGSNEKSVPNCS